MYVHLAKSRDEKILSIHVGELQHLSQCRHIFMQSCSVHCYAGSFAAHGVFVGEVLSCMCHDQNPFVFCVTAETHLRNSFLHFF